MFKLPKNSKIATTSLKNSAIAAGFSFGDASVSIFVASHEATLPFEEIREIPEIIKELLENASIATGIMPKRAVAAVGGGWSQGAMAVVRYNRAESEKPINEREFKKIKEKLSKISLSETEAEVVKTFGTDTFDLVLINSQIAFMKVDDFLTSDPVNLKGKALEIAFTHFFCRSDLLDQIEKALKKQKISLITVTGALAAGLSFPPRELEEVEDFVGLFEAGQSCDLAIVFGNKVIGTKTLPLSIQFAAKNPEWFLRALRETLTSFEGIKTFPPIFAIFGRELGLKTQIETYPWPRFLPFQGAPKVVSVTRGMGEVFPKVVEALG